MTSLTFEDIEEEVRCLAASNPDYVYSSDEYMKTAGLSGAESSNSCFYQHGNGCPGCIFGHTLLKLQFPLAADDEGSGISEVLESAGMSLSSLEQNWLDTVQNKQDSGLSWSVAVQQADELFPL